MLLKTHAALLLPAAQYAATSSYHGAGGSGAMRRGRLERNVHC